MYRLMIILLISDRHKPIDLIDMKDVPMDPPVSQENPFPQQNL
jgi:hypothetical protein